MTHRKPIAFADPSGQVLAPVYNGAPSDYARGSLLTPLYTQEEIDASLARFEASQDAQSAEAPALYGDFDEAAAVVNARRKPVPRQANVPQVHQSPKQRKLPSPPQVTNNDFRPPACSRG